MYLEQQNQQIVSLMAQQEMLKKELEQQKMAAKRDKYRQEYVQKEMEREALDLLEDYEEINVTQHIFVITRDLDQKVLGRIHSENTRNAQTSSQRVLRWSLIGPSLVNRLQIWYILTNRNNLTLRTFL